MIWLCHPRLISIALTFFVVSLIIFLMMHAVPGGPFDGNDMPVSEAVRAKIDGPARPRSAALGAVLQLHVGRAASRFRRALPGAGRDRAQPARRRLAAEPDPRRTRRPHRRAARHSARHGRRAPPQHLDRLCRLDPRDARPHHPGLRHLDAADPGLCRLAPLAAGQRLGQARTLDPADHRLCGDPARDLRALHALGDARHAEPALRHRAARQGPQRAAHHLPARAAQLGDPDGHRVPADVHRHRHRLDLRRGDVPHSRARRLLRLVASRTATIRSRWR